MIQKINEYLETLVQEKGILYDAMRYSLCGGGKRLRPQLAMLAGEAMGGEPMEALPYGAAVECIHTYSLIHDDLPCMDDDDLRRGRPTCHKKYGEAIALLAGDGLLTLAFSVASCAPLAPEKNAAACRIIANYAGALGMVQGQTMDMTMQHASKDEILTMYTHKTSGLLRAAVGVGAVSAGGHGDELDAFAKNLGIAFQLQDDLLDIFGDAAVLGKPIHSDEKNEKNTILSILGAEETKKLVLEYTEAAMDALAPFGKKGEKLRALAESLVERKM
ncbi:MAG: polyprenyl synthetase family protein [Clostridia bacterium]|nr:polyprenyl synthetase family protein [Clostridia bacterium]